MTGDDRLRDLERRWRETGAVEDEIAYLRERVRTGALSTDALGLAASLGHAASERAGGEGLPLEGGPWFEILATRFGAGPLAAAAAVHARLCLARWSAAFPLDEGPAKAIAHAFAWARRPTWTTEASGAAEAALDLADAGVDRASAAAADAALHAALAAMGTARLVHRLADGRLRLALDDAERVAAWTSESLAEPRARVHAAAARDLALWALGG